MKTNIIMRACNDMPVIRQTLKMLAVQKHPFSLIALDNESDDGTREVLAEYTDKLFIIPRGEYIPGRALNLGMNYSEGEFVVFLNSDCTPKDEYWLGNLLQGFDSPYVAAVFGAQLPRHDCHPLHAKDITDTFGNGQQQKYWRHCFSMASSAIRRSVWKDLPFSEQLKYSEDIDWSWCAKQQGYVIKYIPDARVFHSHNYSLSQSYRRQFGEGRAEANIFSWDRWHSSFLRYTLMPYWKRVFKDIIYCIKNGHPGFVFSSPILRAAQALGRWRGLQQGLNP